MRQDEGCRQYSAGEEIARGGESCLGGLSGSQTDS